MKRNIIFSALLLVTAIGSFAQAAKKKTVPKGTTVISSPKLNTDKPNILVIWGDDVGWQNIS